MAKNIYLTRERSLVRKINEAFIALILDYRYSKDQILEAYLNEVYLGQSYNQGVHGMGLAAEFYFAKPVDELEYDQIALLVAMVKGPSYYNPRRYKERAMERRDLVLRLMVDNKLISTKEQLRLSSITSTNFPEIRLLANASNAASASLIGNVSANCGLKRPSANSGHTCRPKSLNRSALN